MIAPKFYLSAGKITLILAVFALYLCLQSIIGIRIQYELGVNNTYFMYYFSEFTDVNAEGNLPAWFSTLLLASSALLLAIIARAKKQREDRYIAHWHGLALIFLYLSMDEGGELHETFSSPLGDIFGEEGLLYFTWVVGGLIFVIIVGLIYAKFLWHLPPMTRNLFLLAGGMYIGGAIGLDAVSGNMWYTNDGISFNYSVVATIEEFFEMQGIILFIYTLMKYLEAYTDHIEIGFRRPPQEV